MKNMYSAEKPKVTMKLEVSFPHTEGGPAKKFSVNRALKARWSSDFRTTTQEILEEIKNYKGSFIGDLIASMASLVKNDEAAQLPENKRSLEIDRWAAHLMENVVYSAVREGIHEDFIQSSELPEWDGSMTKIDQVTPEELKNVDFDRVVLLLTPKLKHALSLMTKNKKFEG
jgi:hypothetical protein